MNRTTLTNLLTTNFATTGVAKHITPAHLRQLIQAIIDSYPNLEDDAALIGSGNYNPSRTYQPGVLTIYQGKNYLVTGEMTGAFDASNAVELPLQEVYFDIDQWDDSTTYSANDLVSFAFRLWKSVGGSNLNNEPSTLVSTYWVEVLAHSGMNFSNYETGKVYQDKVIVDFEGGAYQRNGAGLSSNFSTEIASNKWIAIHPKWKFDSILPPVKYITGATGSTPPTEINGDAYILFDDLGSYFVDTIIFQSGNTVRYTFSDSSNMYSFGSVGATIKITDATNAKHNGKFIITAFNIGGGWVEVSNPNIHNSSNDELAGTAIAFITLIEWDGATVNDWVIYNSTIDRWIAITPSEGQSAIIQYDAKTYTFKNGSWQSQAYVLPEQPFSIRQLTNYYYNVGTTDDQAIYMQPPGTIGFSLFAQTDLIITNAGTTVGLLDDLCFYTGPYRGGKFLFSVNNATLLKLNDTNGVISVSLGNIVRHDNVMLPSIIYASCGTHNGTSTSIKIRFIGLPIQ